MQLLGSAELGQEPGFAILNHTFDLSNEDLPGHGSSIRISSTSAARTPG